MYSISLRKKSRTGLAESERRINFVRFDEKKPLVLSHKTGGRR